MPANISSLVSDIGPGKPLGLYFSLTEQEICRFKTTKLILSET